MNKNTPCAIAFCVVLGAALTGCTGHRQTPAAPASTSPASATTGGVCSAPPAQFAVGQNSTASVVESARQRSGALAARILRPGQVITKEYNAQRLSLEVDGNGRIVAAKCG